VLAGATAGEDCADDCPAMATADSNSRAAGMHR
jgi:hypothetical protein